MPLVRLEKLRQADVGFRCTGSRRETDHGRYEQLHRLHSDQLRQLPLSDAACSTSRRATAHSPDREERAMDVTNEEIIKLVQEKVEEKNAVIREQQSQIHDLQQKVADLEQQLNEAHKQAADREELFKKLSEVVD